MRFERTKTTKIIPINGMDITLQLRIIQQYINDIKTKPDTTKRRTGYRVVIDRGYHVDHWETITQQVYNIWLG